MKKNIILKLVIILLIATLFRMYMLDKPEGLWNDEYLGWLMASKDTFSDFFQQIFRNCHMPFYYIYLKVWMLLFGDSDFVLRMSSVVPSIISIIVMYFVGKEAKDSNTGLLAAFLTAISSFLIYFAQEMRLYSLIFLFSSLETLYFIKYAKQQTKLNASMFFITNALVCVTHTLGIAFAMFNIIVMSFYLYNENEKFKEIIKSITSFLKQIIPFLITVIALLPLIYNIVFTPSLSQFWSEFNFLKILYTFTDYFSPVQINILSPPISFFDMIFYNNKLNWHFTVWAVLPTIIAFYAIYSAILKKNKSLNYALLSAGLFFITMVIIAATGRMILLTKYTIEVYPILITALTFGFLTIDKTKIKSILIFIFIAINVLYLCFAKDAVQKRTRPEGHLAPIQLIENSKLKDNDQIIFTFFDVDKFQKYIKPNNFRFYAIHKYNFPEIMFDNSQNYSYIDIIKEGKSLYRNYFFTFPNERIRKYVDDAYINKMNIGDRIAVIYLKNISIYDINSFNKIINDSSKYKRSHFIFLAFSYLINNILYELDSNLKLESIKKSGDWYIIIYQKVN